MILFLTQAVVYREVYLNIIITEEARMKLDVLGFDITNSIYGILEYISKHDYKGISHILVTDSPVNRKNKNIQSSYIKKQGMNSAYIELYLENIFAHIHSIEIFKYMLPIQEFGIALSIFHEIGHHVRVTLAHNVKNKDSEKFAEEYSKKKMKIFTLKTAKKVEDCFKQLERIANEKKMSLDIIKKMKDGWRDSLEQAR